MVMENGEETETLIRVANGVNFRERKIFMSFARGGKKKEISGHKDDQVNSSATIKNPDQVGGFNQKSDHSTNKENKQDQQPTNAAPDPSKGKMESERKISSKLKVNECFLEEIKNSVILETVNLESVKTISLIVKGPGFNNVMVRGLSSTRFLAFFYEEEKLDKVDMDF